MVSGRTSRSGSLTVSRCRNNINNTSVILEVGKG